MLSPGLQLAPELASKLVRLCAVGFEGAELLMRCPLGMVVKRVDFADYGSPLGTCGSFKRDLDGPHSTARAPLSVRIPYRVRVL